MINEISKKTFVLSIIKFAWSVVSIILMLFIPWNTVVMVISSFAYLAKRGLGSVSGVMSVFSVILMTPLIILAIVNLIKNILLFVAVMQQKNGKKVFDAAQWKKKFKATSIIPAAILYFFSYAFLSEFTYLANFLLYLVILYAIADGVVGGMLKKSMGLGKQKKNASAQESATVEQKQKSDD